MNSSFLLELLGEFLAKSLIILLIGFVVLRIFRSSTPEWKHRMWMRVFLVGLFLPLLLILPRWEWVPNLRTEVPAITASSDPSAKIDRIGEEAKASPLPKPEHKSPPFSLTQIFLVVWSGGVALILLRTLITTLRINRITRRARTPEGEMEKLFQNLAMRLGVTNPSLCLSEEVKSPFAWGLLRPRVCLPLQAQDWTRLDLEMILLHELEHVKRRDTLSVLFSQLFSALNWFNPLAWMAMKQSIQFREEACDSRVILSGHNPTHYSEMLFRQAKMANERFLQICATALAPTAISKPATIEQRIHMILKLNSPTRLTRKPALATVVTLLFVLVGFAGSQNNEDPIPSPSVLKEIVALETKLDEIIIPSVEFVDTPMDDALQFLQLRSVELDVDETDPLKKGINVVLNAPEAKDVRITLRLTDVPLAEALRYTAALARTKMKVTRSAVVIGPVTETADLLNEVFEIPPGFLEFDGVEFTPLQVLDRAGVEFGKGSNVVLNRDGSQLVIRNTETQLKRVRAYIIASAEGKRKSFLAEVAKSWDAPASEKGNSVTAGKLASIRLPAIEFRDTPFTDALQFLQMKSTELDLEETDPSQKGINIILDNVNGVEPRDITLKLINVPLGEALRYTAELAGFTFSAEEHAVVFRPADSKP